ncbi:hypothetical protein NDU88_002444 [Pleurodeles waltl]|uniref:Uncharacterized protein n=1 Tax=Pleurodeles waltl TaxID=8319 RepID=A0AAV7VZN9_PLEWA|nr:hypothetical protein NDU88_002444 [Pleurodeles waltl]
MCGSSRNEPLRYGPPIGEEEEMLGGAVLLGGCLRGCPPPQLVQPYVTAYSWHGSRCVGLPLNSWPEESSGATRIDERGAPGAMIWFEQIGTGGKRIPPPPCFISALGTYGDGRPLKLLEEAKALLKHNSIQKKLDQELVQQEDTLNALQRLINNGDALENESRGDIGALWSRLASYICKDFQQRLHREGDRSGCLLAWLLRRECPTPIILSLRGPTGDRILGQTRVNVHLREHLEAIYSSPWCDVGSQTREYLDGLWLPRLTDAQAAELEAEFSLEDLQGALGDMASGRAPGLDGLPVEFYHAYSATLLPRLLEILQESGEGGLLPQQMREALIVMLPKTGRDPADPSSYRPLSM